MRIMVVGTHGSGKTTLVHALREMGYSAYAFAQEHSASPHVWRRRHPDVLIALFCSYATLVQRRGIQWPKGLWRRQLYALGDAWAHADIRMQTDTLTPDELITRVAKRLHQLIGPPRGERPRSC